MLNYKVMTVDLGVVGGAKLEIAAKRNEKSINDFVVSFFTQKVQCGRKRKNGKK